MFNFRLNNGFKNCVQGWEGKEIREHISPDPKIFGELGNLNFRLRNVHNSNWNSFSLNFSDIFIGFKGKIENASPKNIFVHDLILAFSSLDCALEMTHANDVIWMFADNEIAILDIYAQLELIPILYWF